MSNLQLLAKSSNTSVACNISPALVVSHLIWMYLIAYRKDQTPLPTIQPKYCMPIRDIMSTEPTIITLLWQLPVSGEKIDFRLLYLLTIYHPYMLL